MKLLISELELKNYKSRQKIPLECEYCKKVFYSEKREYKRHLKDKKGNSLKFCCDRCRNLYKGTKQICDCLNCKTKFDKTSSAIKKTKGNFCSQSCAATYHNTHKTIGIRRSKIESFLEKQLTLIFPKLKILYNNKNIINSEIDIYIPSLSLAFELNGIFHYEPIFGNEKFKQIKNNDQRKLIACYEYGIELCIIDISKLIHFKPEKAQIFLDIIIKIINQKIERIKNPLTNSKSGG